MKPTPPKKRDVDNSGLFLLGPFGVARSQFTNSCFGDFVSVHALVDDARRLLSLSIVNCERDPTDSAKERSGGFPLVTRPGQRQVA